MPKPERSALRIKGDLAALQARATAPLPAPNPNVRECPSLMHRGPRLQPIEKFWSRNSRTLRKTCATCRHQRAIRHRNKTAGIKRRARLTAEAYWNQQAATH